MTDFLSPMTRVTKVQKGPIVTPGSGTAVAGFEVVTQKGPACTPTLITSTDDFKEVFGDQLVSRPEAVDSLIGFFGNGGSSCYINRIVGAGALAASRTLSVVGPAGYGSVATAVGPFVLSDGDQITAKTEGSVATITIDVVAKPATLAFQGSWAAGVPGETVSIAVPGVPGVQVIDLSSATNRTTYGSEIQRQLLGANVFVSDNPDDGIVITTDMQGTVATSNSFVAAVSEESVTTKTGLITGNFSQVSGSNVSNVRAVTSQELAPLAPGSDIIVSSVSGALVFTRAVSGAIHSVQITSAPAAMGLSLAVHPGTDTTTVGTLLVDASSVGAWGNDVKVKATRSDDVITKAVVTTAGTYTKLTLLSASRVQVGDQLSITNGGGVTRGTVSRVDGNEVYFSAPVTVYAPGLVAQNVINETFSLEVYDRSGRLISAFKKLRMSPLAGPRFYGAVVNSAYRTPVILSTLSSPAEDTRPPTDTVPVAMSSGSDGSAVSVADFSGVQASKTGVWAWDKAKDVNFISIPGIHSLFSSSDSALILKEVEAYCETRGDVQAVFSVPPGFAHAAMKSWVTDTANFNSKYLNVYGPHVYALDQFSGVKALKDPTGHILGAISRTHQTRNFAKAPAGIVDGQIRGIFGLEFEYDEGSAEYDNIFPVGVNLILKFIGEGYAIWGDKTLDATEEYDSVGEVTGFNVAEREVKKLTRWVSFEPNDEATRRRVTLILKALFRQWRLDGILMGESDEEAFFIVCDATNNTPSVIASHKLKCRIGLAFIQSSRFLDFTLEQDTRAIEASLASA
jgi:phage tail sheath protein FI